MPVHYLIVTGSNVLCRWVRGMEPPMDAAMYTRDRTKVTCIRCLDALEVE